MVARLLSVGVLATSAQTLHSPGVARQRGDIVRTCKAGVSYSRQTVFFEPDFATAQGKLLGSKAVTLAHLPTTIY
jgi:hypothetical protein